MTYLFSEDTLMSSPESVPGTSILSGAAGSFPKLWEIKITLKKPLNCLLFKESKNLHTIMKGYKSSSMEFLMELD